MSILVQQKLPMAVLLAPVFATLVLAGCGGGSSGSGSARATGSLVVPDAGEEGRTVARMIDSAGWLARSVADDCPDVPAGYRPLAAATVNFLDASGDIVGDAFTTDACGFFDAKLPDNATDVRATADGFRDLLASVTVFEGDTTTAVASTIPIGSTYRIGSLQRLDDARVGFTVTDSESGQAVLGLPSSVFDVRIDDAEVDIAAMSTAALTPSYSVTTLVLDASPSMDEVAYVDPATGDEFTRSQLAVRAAHVFLDQKADADEVSITPFSRRPFSIDQGFIDETLTLETLAGEPTTFELGTTGFSTDARPLRFAVDLYGRKSDLYEGGTDPRHPDTPADLRIASGFPFPRFTAIHDAIIAGVERVSTRDGESRFVVAMSDGNDNASSASIDDAIAAAQSDGVAVYTVGFGDDADEEGLERVATSTGASYFKVEGTDIGDAFQSIQSGIVFRYIAALEGSAPGGVALDMATRLEITLEYGGERAVREVQL